MILNNVDHVVAEFKSVKSVYSDRVGERIAQKGLDLISALQSADGPEKWIDYVGHLTLSIYHAPRFGIEGKRAMPQVLIDPRHTLVFGEVKYLLPFEHRPWEYLGGRANDIPTALALIADALVRCEQRPEHLYEDLGS